MATVDDAIQGLLHFRHAWQVRHMHGAGRRGPGLWIARSPCPWCLATLMSPKCPTNPCQAHLQACSLAPSNGWQCRAHRPHVPTRDADDHPCRRPSWLPGLHVVPRRTSHLYSTTSRTNRSATVAIPLDRSLSLFPALFLHSALQALKLLPAPTPLESRHDLSCSSTTSSSPSLMPPFIAATDR